MLKRRLPFTYGRGTSTWLYVRGCALVVCMGHPECSVGNRRRIAGEEAQPLDPREEQVRTAADRRECGNARELLPHRALRDHQVQRAVLRADDGIPRVRLALEVRVVGPDAHHELELPDQAPTPHERRDATIEAVIGLVGR